MASAQEINRYRRLQKQIKDLRKKKDFVGLSKIRQPKQD